MLIHFNKKNVSLDFYSISSRSVKARLGKIVSYNKRYNNHNECAQIKNNAREEILEHISRLM